MNILIDEKITKFTHEDFPMFINGIAFVNSGASFFSVSLMTKLAQSGEKIVFFTGFSPAKELFREQISGDNTDKDNIIIIDSGDEDNFINRLNEIKDLEERIVLFKNIEEYSTKLFDKLKNHKLVIFSGDIDNCEFKEELTKMDFKTKIFFSYPETMDVSNKIELPKYSGHIMGNKNGVVRFEI